LEDLEKSYRVYKVDAMEEAKKLGNSKIFNVIVLGIAAQHMNFSKEEWLTVIENTVPAKTVEINKKAFETGYNLH
jgi:indolepyruvate ferredoxin oxidoreductase beta subunit